MAFGARIFNGSSDYINCGGASGSLDIAGDFTLSAWIYMPVSTTGDIMGKWDSALCYLLYVDTGTVPTIVIRTASGFKSSNSGAVSTGAWHHVAGIRTTVPGVSITLKVCLDGAYPLGDSYGASDNNNTGDIFAIGAQQLTSTPAGFFNGLIADAAVWNTNLLAGEVAALASGLRPYNIRQPNLVGYWPLDGVNSPEPDLSSFSHNGVLTGTVNAAGPPLAMSTPRWPMFTAAAAPATAIDGLVVAHYANIKRVTNVIGY